MESKFNDIISRHEKLLEKNRSIFNVIGYIKLLLVLVLCISLYFTYKNNYDGKLVLVVAIELAVIILIWIYHENLHQKVDYSAGIIDINKRHLDRLSGKWTAFSDMGEEFVNQEHPYACDLDVVGKKSLFQFLNASNTWHGRQAFAADLLQPAYIDGEIQKRQQAILELSRDIEFSNQIEYYLSKIGVDNSAPKLVAELKDKRLFIKNKAIKIALLYTPLIILLFIALIVIFDLKNLYFIGIILYLIQGIVWLAGILKTQRYIGRAASLPYKLSSYSEVIKYLKDRQFTSNTLKQIQAKLGMSDLSAEQGIKDLCKIADKMSIRNNPVIYFILNVLWLWDYSCALMFEEWKQKYADLSEEWFLALGEFESLLSFSNLVNVCNNTCMPVIESSEKAIEAKELGHPLLNNNVRVNNDLKLNNNIFVISGSNMSGKTTFLRTVGINLVLACSGSFVCANQMSFSPMKLMTSMRIADDLNEGVSTFYAELRRIKDIIELAKKEPNMLFLIDEIFRGTNSIDRLTGAKTVISKLSEIDTAGIITTHDLELCELSKQYLRIKNYSFSEYYENNKIYFDYKMRSGKSNTTNAKYLMEMVGII